MSTVTPALPRALPHPIARSQPALRARGAASARGVGFVQAFCQALGLPAHCVRDGCLELRWQDDLEVNVVATPWNQVTVMVLLGPAEGLSARQWLALTTQTSDLGPWPWAGQLLVQDSQLWLNWAVPADSCVDEAVEHALSFLGAATDARALVSG